MFQDNKKKPVKKLSLFQKVQLSFIGLAAGIAATFTSVKAPETNLASSINLNQSPQHSIVEEKQVIEKEKTTKIPEVKNGFDKFQQTQPIKTSFNTDGTIKVEIDKKLISKSNTTKPIQEIKKFKSILPTLSFGQTAQAYSNDEYLEFLQLSKMDIVGVGADPRSVLGRGFYTAKGAQIVYGCLEKNFTSNDGICGRNSKMVNISKNTVLNNYRGECSEGYENKAAKAYARANNLSYLFYNPQNQSYTFEKK
jgi:hypothetical protein